MHKRTAVHLIFSWEGWNMKKAVLAAITVTVLYTSGCAYLGGNPEPSATAPRMVQGWFGIEWDYPGYFGIVPASKQLEGYQRCAPLRAVGYNPRAEDTFGRAFPTGGFLCAS